MTLKNILTKAEEQLLEEWDMQVFLWQENYFKPDNKPQADPATQKVIEKINLHWEELDNSVVFGSDEIPF